MPHAAVIGALKVVGPALVSGAFGLGASKISSNANSKASTIQDLATQRAEAFQREESAKEEARYAKEQAQKQAQWDYEQQRRSNYRNALAKRLGIDPGAEPAMPMPTDWSPTPATAVSAPTPQAPQKHRSIGSMLGLGAAGLLGGYALSKLGGNSTPASFGSSPLESPLGQPTIGYLAQKFGGYSQKNNYGQ